MSVPAGVSHLAEVFAESVSIGPQIPAIGALMVMRDVIIPGEMTVNGLVQEQFEPNSTDYRYVVVEAVSGHRDAGMPPITMRPNTVAHAREQVDSQIAMALAALRTGDDSIQPDNVHPVDSADIGGADFFLSYRANRALAGALVTDILAHVEGSDAVQDVLQRYRDDIARISIEGQGNIDARKQALAQRRIALMRELESGFRQGAARHAHRKGVEAFLRVILLPDSTPELLVKHGLPAPPEQ